MRGNRDGRELIETGGRKARRMGRVLAALALSAAVAAGVPACGEGAAAAAPKEEAPPIKVTAVTAQVRDVPRVVRSVGSIAAIDRVTIAPEIDGMVVEVPFTEGAAVEVGDVLVRLDDAIAASEAESARAVRDRAKLRLTSLQEARSAGGASTFEIDDAKVALAEAEALYQQRRLRLEDHVVRAPFDGRVGRRLVSPGAVLSSGDAVTTLTAVDPVDVVFNLPAVELGRLEEGQEVVVSSRAFGEETFEGGVTVIGPTLDERTRTVPVVARIGNPEGRLRPGLFVDVRVTVGALRSAVVVPETAVRVEGNRAEVAVIEEGAAVRRRVEIGQRLPGLAVIVDGLSGGEVVVTSNLNKVPDGARVEAGADELAARLGIEWERDGREDVAETDGAEPAGSERAGG